MPTDPHLSALIRHVNWLVALLANSGGVYVPMPTYLHGDSHGTLTYLDPTGEEVELTIRLLTSR